MTNHEAALIAFLAHSAIIAGLAIYLRITKPSFNEKISTAYERYKNADRWDLKLIALFILLVVLFRRSQYFSVVAYFLIGCKLIVSIYSNQKSLLDVISEFIEKFFNSEIPPQNPTIQVPPNGQ
jgi:ABC-type Fe3+ transport system permease subunit